MLYFPSEFLQSVRYSGAEMVAFRRLERAFRLETLVGREEGGCSADSHILAFVTGVPEFFVV